MLLLVLPCIGRAQSIFPNTSFASQTFTASAQTGATIGLSGSSYGTISVSGTFSAATFGVKGSNDGGAHYFPINIATVLAPGTVATTVVASTTSLYQVNLAGLTNVEFVTSGTFTGTSAIIHLTTTSNPGVFSASGGSGGPVTFDQIGGGTNDNGLVMGTGGVLTYTGGGFINANELAGTSILGITGPAYLSAGIPSAATSAQLVTALNNSPSSTLSASLLPAYPTAQGTAGAVQYTTGSGVFAGFGGSGSTGLLKLNGAGAPTIAVAGTDYAGLTANTYTGGSTYNLTATANFITVSNTASVNTWIFGNEPSGNMCITNGAISSNLCISPLYVAFNFASSIGFTSVTGSANAAPNVAISSGGAGILDVGNGSVGNTSGTLIAAMLQSGGSTFSVAGCGTATSLIGGSTGGKFTGGSATCTPVVTTGKTAAHGYSCSVSDETTVTAGFRETGSNPTTVTFTAAGVVGATDVIDFGCQAN